MSEERTEAVFNATNFDENEPAEASHPNDSIVVAAVRRALEHDVLVAHERIEVSSCRSWVTLRGEVASSSSRVYIEMVVRLVEGVHGVTNEIAVIPNQPPDPSRMFDEP